jgi:hypothetical protein
MAIVAQVIQVIAVVVGVIISVRTFAHSQEKDRQERLTEANKQIVEAQKYRAQRETEARRPFAELRQRLYSEAIQSAAVLSNPGLHTATEIAAARARFWELYWGELSLVEGQGVESAMKKLGDTLDPGHAVTPAQVATYDLAHRLRDSLQKTWGMTDIPEPERP